MTILCLRQVFVEVQFKPIRPLSAFIHPFRLLILLYTLTDPLSVLPVPAVTSYCSR